MAQTKKQQLALVLTMVFHQEDHQWVGVCKEIGTSTFDKDLEKAKQELMEMTCEHLTVLNELGELKDFLKRHRIVHAFGGNEAKTRRVTVPVEESPKTMTSTVQFQIPCVA